MFLTGFRSFRDLQIRSIVRNKDKIQLPEDNRENRSMPNISPK